MVHLGSKKSSKRLPGDLILVAFGRFLQFDLNARMVFFKALFCFSQGIFEKHPGFCHHAQMGLALFVGLRRAGTQDQNEEIWKTKFHKMEPFLMAIVTCYARCGLCPCACAQIEPIRFAKVVGAASNRKLSRRPLASFFHP